MYVCVYIHYFSEIALLQVKNTGSSWHDAKHSLRKDPRWGMAELLESNEREKMFWDHIDSLLEKKRQHFRRLLDDTSQVKGFELLYVA